MISIVIFEVAIKNNNLQVVNYFIHINNNNNNNNNNQTFKFQTKDYDLIFKYSCKHKNIQLFKDIYQSLDPQLEKKKITTKDGIHYLINDGNLELLKFYLNHYKESDEQSDEQVTQLLYYSASSKHLEIFQFIVEFFSAQKLFSSDITFVSHNNLEMLQYFLTLFKDEQDQQLSKQIVKCAIGYGDLKVLDYLYNSKDHSIYLAKYILLSGKLDLIKYFSKKLVYPTIDLERVLQCIINQEEIQESQENTNNKILIKSEDIKFLVELGCTFTSDNYLNLFIICCSRNLYQAIIYLNLPLFKPNSQIFMVLIMKYPNQCLDIIKFLFSDRQKFPSRHLFFDMVRCSIKYNSFQVFEYLSQYFGLSYYSTTNIDQDNNHDNEQYIFDQDDQDIVEQDNHSMEEDDNDFDDDDDDKEFKESPDKIDINLFYDRAIKYNQLEILELLDKKYRNQISKKYIKGNNNIEIIRYLVNNQHICNSQTIEYAIIHQNYKAIQYLSSMIQSTLSINYLITSIKYNSFTIFKHLLDTFFNTSIIESLFQQQQDIKQKFLKCFIPSSSSTSSNNQITIVMIEYFYKFIKHIEYFQFIFDEMIKELGQSNNISLQLLQFLTETVGCHVDKNHIQLSLESTNTIIINFLKSKLK
ncbi:hypothetical protein CYY_003720 [Polysphondylium violaceum]|uniref:Ankyrin repeat-containing protein n=1 Tax=Polysphondylium violaceum TaxID=133409 RepID=A0A8J4Q6H5_9MYCE|nr:hypothetical protein CYY_003720 [Polysphondylium violaceum]